MRYASGSTRTAPSKLDLAQLDAPLISAFLDHLETERGCSARTRNARLAAIRWMFKYAALGAPTSTSTTTAVDSKPRSRRSNHNYESRSASQPEEHEDPLAPPVR